MTSQNKGKDKGKGRGRPGSGLAGHGKVDDLADHLGIGEAGFPGGHGEFLSAGEPWVGIRFDDVDLALVERRISMRP